MTDHTKYGGAADGMESSGASFSVAVEFSYSDEAGNRVSEDILLPVNKATLRALEERAGDSGFLGGEARLIHNSEDVSESGDDIVSFALDSYYSLDDLNGYAERINRLDDLSQVILRDAVAWLENDDMENMFFMVEALNTVTERGAELDVLRKQMSAKRQVDGYDVIQSVKIDGQEIIVGENLKAEKPYLLWHRSINTNFGDESHMKAVRYYDYTAIMREFSAWVSRGVDSLELDRVYRGSHLVDSPLVIDDCVKGGIDANCEGMVIAIKQDVFSPEFRSLCYK